MSARHGKPLRGLMSTKTSPLFQGRFGRMFRSLPAAKYGKDEAASRDNLMKLGGLMTSTFDPPTDGPDPEESGIPALYTYFGQFIDHDITFDPMSTLIKHTDPDALTDFRTPAFDLDNVYGRGPDDQPYMYDGHTFLLGDKIGGGSDPNAQDLARNNADPRRAIIGDPRNDENSIVSQLQGLFLRFHNRTVKDHPEIDPASDFDKLQKIVRFHYHFVILNDFLPRIIHSSVLADLKTNGHYDRHKLKFFRWRDEPFMPVEFSVAAYRLGHSMIRPGYRLNDAVLQPIFPVSKTMSPPDGFPEGLTGFRAMNPAWAIDWGRLIDVDTRAYGVDKQPPDGPTQKRLQFAYRLDTSLVAPLSELPPSVATNPPSLPQRNLLRSFELGLPSGQDVARAMHVTPLKDIEIMIGKAVDTPGAGDVKGTIASLSDLSPFKDNCPLWTYILAEAARNPEPVKIPVQEDKTITTPRLGPVGGRIVAEVFLGLMFGDNDSLLNLEPHWTPSSGQNYRLKDFVQYALGS
jgi:Animal haem peroxidase